jgi:hypothetical protein
MTTGPTFGRYDSPAEILANKDLRDPEQRALAVAELTGAEEARYGAVLAKAEELSIPVQVEGPGNKVSILYDFLDDEPIYRTTLNANAAISTGANLIRQNAPYNLDGSGLKVGIWDAGSVRNTHQEFSTARVVKKNATAAESDHSTHVAGTIGATGIDAQGAHFCLFRRHVRYRSNGRTGAGQLLRNQVCRQKSRGGLGSGKSFRGQLGQALWIMSGKYFQGGVQRQPALGEGQVLLLGDGL